MFKEAKEVKPSMLLFCLFISSLIAGLPAGGIFLFLIVPRLKNFGFSSTRILFVTTILIWLTAILITEKFSTSILKHSHKIRKFLGFPIGKECSTCGAEITSLPWGIKKNGLLFLCGDCLRKSRVITL